MDWFDSNEWLFAEVSSDFIGDTRPMRSIVNRQLGSLGKICSSCYGVLEIKKFYKKGTRRDSRCRQCLLQDKKEQRLRKKAVKKRAPRGRVLDIESFAISITPISEVDSGAADCSYQQWIDFTLGD